MMPRRSGDTLTRLTTVMAGIFFVTSLFLAIVASHRPVEKSILDGVTGSNAGQKPAAVAGKVKDKMKEKMKDGAKEAAGTVKEAAGKATEAAKQVKDKAAEAVKKTTESTPAAPVTK